MDVGEDQDAGAGVDLVAGAADAPDDVVELLASSATETAVAAGDRADDAGRRREQAFAAAAVSDDDQADLAHARSLHEAGEANAIPSAHKIDKPSPRHRGEAR